MKAILGIPIVSARTIKFYSPTSSKKEEDLFSDARHFRCEHHIPEDHALLVNLVGMRIKNLNHND